MKMKKELPVFAEISLLGKVPIYAQKPQIYSYITLTKELQMKTISTYDAALYAIAAFAFGALFVLELL
jgi:hypothetical protein